MTKLQVYFYLIVLIILMLSAGKWSLFIVIPAVLLHPEFKKLT